MDSFKYYHNLALKNPDILESTVTSVNLLTAISEILNKMRDTYELYQVKVSECKKIKVYSASKEYLEEIIKFIKHELVIEYKIFTIYQNILNKRNINFIYSDDIEKIKKLNKLD